MCAPQLAHHAQFLRLLDTFGPDEFVPLAENTALIGPLTRYVLGAALAQARTWLDAGRPLPIAVNLSARNLHDEHFAEMVAELLAAHGVPAALLELEVTAQGYHLSRPLTADAFDIWHTERSITPLPPITPDPADGPAPQGETARITICQQSSGFALSPRRQVPVRGSPISNAMSMMSLFLLDSHRVGSDHAPEPST